MAEVDSSVSDPASEPKKRKVSPPPHSSAEDQDENVSKPKLRSSEKCVKPVEVTDNVEEPLKSETEPAVTEKDVEADPKTKVVVPDSKPETSLIPLHELFNEVEVEDLKNAAFQNRLPFDKMSKDESIAFADVIEQGEAMLQEYLILRNNILRLWLDNPVQQLLCDAVRESLDLRKALYNRELLVRIHAYLDRWGHINFGMIQILTKPPMHHGKKVIIVGAGISGLAAAQQLKRFGFNVTVLEGRDRVGGRIATFRGENSSVADLGAMIVTGLGGNPLAVLSRQFDVKLSKINSDDCPLYDASGERVPNNHDKAVEAEFNRLLDAAAYIGKEWKFGETEPKTALSLGKTMEVLITMQEKYIREKLVYHWEKYVEFQNEYTSVIRSRRELLKIIQPLLEKRRKAKLDNAELPPVSESEKMVVKQMKDLVERSRILQHILRRMEAVTPPKVYFSSSDRQLIDWHFANLEFANATQLRTLSLTHWNQDDAFELTGPHLCVRNGFSCIPIALASNLRILLNTSVKEIQYNDSGIKVMAAHGRQPPSAYRADAVLVTLPLGVLKRCVENNGVTFNPPLPDWKKSAIEKLNFGTLNKLVLVFDAPFWHQDIQVFGHVSKVPAMRGSMFLFFNIYGGPVLIALVAGDAASALQSVSDGQVQAHCMAILRKMFTKDIPDPVKAVVTRWDQDPFSYGSYSSVGTRATGEDYDVMAESLTFEGSESPRVFFGGEHTVRNYPATVHGAFLSGLREAGKIANAFLGEPYLVKKEP
ncbi:unnamed protein product [Notodromas monacha]|uniref:Lysine-specific histone demethylase n=1 Tax=Notodromas monacha TaxID=399045 RepID=A0A7R9BUG3_9CRUS|nr:unnamed protein product [Notodromas monacha]CAG0920574.1 unnamed protein product [Notodromas monacha]